MVLWIVLAVVAAICLLICIVVVLLRWRATKAAAKNKSGFKAFDPGEEMKKSDQGSKGSPKSKMIDFDEDFGEQTLKQISVAPVPDDSPGLLTRQPNSPRKKGKVDDAALPEGTSKTNYVELNDLLHGSQTSKRPYSPAASLGSMRSSRKGSPAGSPVRRPSAVAGADSPLLESSLPPLRASAPSPTRQSRRPSAPGPATPVSNFDAPITLLDI
ncbi:hypothetical protein DIPPA_06651 [Diplonema papillatum]|nr:hypothetical protein DIPPA_11478 [Diplonema papillatum]KAJ9449170.1 hypothetical protein DIPPA_06651 [Diplonema papillatum]